MASAGASSVTRADLAAAPEDQDQVSVGVAHVADPLRHATGGDEVLRSRRR